MAAVVGPSVDWVEIGGDVTESVLLPMVVPPGGQVDSQVVRAAWATVDRGVLVDGAIVDVGSAIKAVEADIRGG